MDGYPDRSVLSGDIFVRPDVTGCISRDTALVCRRAEGIVPGIDRRAAGQQRLGQGWTAVVCQQVDPRIRHDKVGPYRVAAAVREEVGPQGVDRHRAGSKRRQEASIGHILSYDAVDQVEGGAAIAKGADEYGSWRK